MHLQQQRLSQSIFQINNNLLAVIFEFILIVIIMKKLQNQITKHEPTFKKRIQNSFLKYDFTSWSKSNLHKHTPSQTHQRSKSPQQHYRSFNSIQKKDKERSVSKENNAKFVNNTSNNNSIKCKLISSSKKQLSTKNIEIKKLTKGNSRKVLEQRYLNNNTNHKNSRSFTNLYQGHKQNRCNSSYIKSHIKSAESSINEYFQSNKKEQIKFNYSYRTRQGVLATNPNKKNQDSLLIKTKLMDKNINIFAVADGHGTYGHFVSQSLAKNFTKQCQHFLPIYPPQQALPKVYSALQKILTQPDINASCSGSTLVSVLIQNNKLFCANAGDSRAVLARQIQKKSWEMIYLSQDHKPSIESQKKRIIKNGGRVHCFKDQNGNPIGPLRVWLPNQNIQGLAMSRSLGDNISKPIGVTHIPQIINVQLDKRDKFILLASDGVWQFISNHQILQLIVPFYRQNKLQQACDALLKLSYDRWTVEDNSVVDDITFILVFLEA